MILRSKERGLSGVMTNLSKAQGSMTDEQRQVSEELNLSRSLARTSSFGGSD